jgi:2-polyprenyl-3-methyl-5-hydroxy-6-metoxy-1,4-benzoquinol methylase
MAIGTNDKQILINLVKAFRKKTNPGLGQFGSFTSAYQYQRLYKLFRQFVKVGSKVLDWGAGEGHFSYWLDQSGYKATGYGFDNFSYKNLVGPGYNYVQGNFNSPKKIPFENKTFDAVSSIGVLEHVRDTGGDEIASLNELKRVLKPKGVFVCYHLPNKFSWIEFLAKFVPGKHHHNNRYTEKEIKELVQLSGFELLSIGKYGFLPRNSWGKFGDRIAYSSVVNYIWEAADNIFSFVFRPICQNYYFVARKK